MATQENKEKRFGLDCREAGEAGKGCSLKLTGTYDEVLETGTIHGIKAHGMEGDEAQVREEIKGFIKEEPQAEGPSYGGEKFGAQQPRPS